MLCVTVVAMGLGALGCLDEQVTAPQLAVAKDGGSLLAPQFGPDSIQALNYCGGKLLIRSAHDTAYTVKWKAQKASGPSAIDSGFAVLPARDTGAMYSSKLIVPALTGYFSFTVYKPSGELVSASSSSTASCPEIPTTAPSNSAQTMAAIYSPGNLLGVAYGFPEQVSRNTVMILFKTSATSADRRAAIDSIQGEVIGGTSMGRGLLHVRFPLNGDSISAGPVDRAVQKLRSLPQVERVNYDWKKTIGVPTYLTPIDGAGFASWRVLPNAADGDNWGLEAIAAPLAWGCTTGSSAARIAVFDRNIKSSTDLTNNLGAIELTTDTLLPHGTAVAGVIAANSNNGEGITGVLWNANLHLRNIEPDAEESVHTEAGREYWKMIRLVRAHNIRVVNLSLGRWWRKDTMFKKMPPDPMDTLKYARAEELVQQMAFDLAFTIDELNKTGHAPLFVVSASNDGIDAKWSGYPGVKKEASLMGTDYARRVLVVGAAKKGAPATATYWTEGSYASNRDSLVDVVAPGDEIHTLGSGGNSVIMGGSSIAVPFATGVAGLLLANDSTLSGDSLKTLIVQGAVNGGGRVMDGTRAVPYLNAYESLRLLARNNRSPMCGNRIWHDSASILVERTTGSKEILKNVGTNRSIRDIQVLHGGREVYFSSQPRSLLATSDSIIALKLQLSDTTWTMSTVSDVPENSTRNRWSGNAHSGFGGVYAFPIWSAPTQPDLTAGVLVSYANEADVQNETYIPATYADLKSPAAYAYAPHGGRALVTVAGNAGSSIYEIDVWSRGVAQRQFLTGRIIYNLSFNEAENEIAIVSGNMTQAIEWSDSTLFQGVWLHRRMLRGDDCRVQFYKADFDSFALLRSEPLGLGCLAVYWADAYGAGGGPYSLGEGTHAPLRIKAVRTKTPPSRGDGSKR